MLAQPAEVKPRQSRLSVAGGKIDGTIPSVEFDDSISAITAIRLAR